LPKDFRESLTSYDLVVIHEPTYMPSKDLQHFVQERKGRGIHVDLYEDHINGLSRIFLEKFAFESYWKWELGHLRKVIKKMGPNISVSSVSDWISQVFARNLDVKVSTIRNAPAMQNLKPSRTDLDCVQLVHHGVGTTHRGIEQAIIAMRSLPDRFNLNFHLVAGPMYMLKIKCLAILCGVTRRVRFHKPVPTKEISAKVNSYDIALIVIPPITENELHALPNKFLESIQGRLAIVTGPNPSMAEVVNASGIGVVISGWASQDIVSGLLDLDLGKISTYKNRTEEISSFYSSLSDRQTFLECVSRTLGKKISEQ
jgi:glycosyltransferase involved in cell wall biosynthesis